MTGSLGYAPVYELTRGRIVESVHFGAAAVVDSNGRLLASIGDPYLATFLRSTAKPIQALPFIEAGGHKHFNFTPKQIALICASHAGTDDHVETVKAIHAATGVAVDDLQCGIHEPMDQETRDRRMLAGQAPTPYHHNCSGKHSGMLAHAKLRHLSLDDYLDPAHPNQQRILQTLSEMAAIPVKDIEIGIDGCSAPNFAIPLYNAALSFARLAGPSGLSPQRAEACRTITAAMMAHPDMIAGPDRFDTDMMRAAKGRIFTKGGAEGFQGVGVLPEGERSVGIGIAVKISDGGFRNRLRARVTMEILARLGLLAEAEIEAMSGYCPVEVLRNYKEKEVGQGRPAFTLEKP